MKRATAGEEKYVEESQEVKEATKERREGNERDELLLSTRQHGHTHEHKYATCSLVFQIKSRKNVRWQMEQKQEAVNQFQV